MPLKIVDAATEINVIDKYLQLLKEEEGNPEQNWWLSYADENEFKGVIIVKATGFASAYQKAVSSGLNLDGEVTGCPVGTLNIPEEFCNRVLTKEECAQFGGKSIAEWEEEEKTKKGIE